MGLALYIELEKEIPGFDPFVNGKAVARAGDVTEPLAKELGVKPLMDFYAVNEEAAALAREEAGIEVETGGFFDPADGLRTIEALSAAISDRKDRIQNSNRVLKDLAEYRAVLERAREAGVRWRFAFDI